MLICMASQKLLLRCRVAVVGGAAVGKTSLVSMLSSGGKAFPKNYKMTSSPELMSAAVTSEDGTAAVEFLLLDTAGAEVFADLSLACLADSYHVALVYDVSSRDSFLECQRWLEVVQKGRSDPRRALHAVLIANKADLPPARHTVTQQEGADWAAHNHCTFFQIAAGHCSHRQAAHIKSHFSIWHSSSSDIIRRNCSR